jgi:hypothetical protein
MREWRVGRWLSVRVYQGPRTRGFGEMTLEIGIGSGRHHLSSPHSLWKRALLDIYLLAIWSFMLWWLWRQGALGDPFSDLLLSVSLAAMLYLRAKDWWEIFTRSPRE